MTSTDQPADLDRIRRAVVHYAQTGSDDIAHELTAELLPLIAEIGRLRAEKETLLDHLGHAADKLLAAGWDDVANQMEAGTYQPANLA